MLPTSGDHVREWRERRHWTQAEAARWYGVSDRTWRRWETGETRVPAPVLKRIASTRIATLRRKG